MTVRSRLLKAGAVLASSLLVVTSTQALALAQDAGGDPAAAFTVDDAEFRWGINHESGTKAPAPNTTNFLSAGDVSGNLSGNYSTLPPGDWKAAEGDVVIERRDSSGTVRRATEADTKKDRDGADLTRTSQYNGLEAVFTGGRGEIDPETGTGTIEWDGTVTVLFYSGYTYFTISDPVLDVTARAAEVTGTLKAHRTDMNNMELWEEMAPKEVTLATLDRGDVDLEDDLGFLAIPDYLGVEYTPKLDELPDQYTSDQYFGAFPEDFVDYVADAGSGPYWYSSGGAADRRKVPFPINVCWDTSECRDVTPPDTDGGGGGGGSGSGGLLTRVINDFVEGVVYDIADIFQTRIREDLDSVINGDADWSDLGSSDLNSGRGTGVSAGATGDAGTAADESYSSPNSPSRQSGDLPDEGVPVNAGTVGYAVTTQASGGSTSPSSSGGASRAPSSSGSDSGPGGAGGAQDASANQFTLTQPAQAGEVYYAQTSASQQAGNSAGAWQWWVGAAMLAVAGALFYPTVRRKVLK